MFDEQFYLFRLCLSEVDWFALMAVILIVMINLLWDQNSIWMSSLHVHVLCLLTDWIRSHTRSRKWSECLQTFCRFDLCVCHIFICENSRSHLTLSLLLIDAKKFHSTIERLLYECSFGLCYFLYLEHPLLRLIFENKRCQTTNRFSDFGAKECSHLSDESDELVLSADSVISMMKW